MRINHNVTALNTYRQLTTNTDNQSKSIEKLSSGLRINRAGDDAAGLAISEKMRGQIRGLDQASRNAQDGISLIQTAEGALNETHDILQRMRELATQSASDTNTSTDRQNIQKEVDQLSTEITRISNTTEFNKQTLLNGGVSANGVSAATFQIGANAGQNLSLTINAMDAKSLGVAADQVTGATGTGAGKISSTSVFDSTNLGTGVVNGAVISATYTAGTAAVAGSPATSGSYTGTAAAGAATANGTLNLKYDGTAVNVTVTSGDSVATMVSNINAAANTAMGTTGKTYAQLDGTGKLNLTSTTTGTTSTVQILGTSTAQTLTDLNIAAATGTGTAAVASVAATNAKVTLSDLSGNTQSVDIADPTKTSFATTSGVFSGITFNLTGAISTLSAGPGVDKITVATTINAASAAKFVGGQKTADAFAGKGIDVSSSASAASNAITTIDAAIQTVSAERAKLGAVQNRMEHTINNLNTSSENLTSAESRIRDVDMAKEMMNQSKSSILAQAAQAMLAQANQQPQGVLQLLRG